MKLSAETFRNFGPVAWILAVAAFLSAATGLYRLGVAAYENMYLRTNITGEICNFGATCFKKNQKFLNSLVRHIAESRAVTIDVTYETYNGPPESCTGNYFSGEDHTLDHDLIQLPLAEGDCLPELRAPAGTFKFVNSAMGTGWYRATGKFYVGAVGLSGTIYLTDAE